MENLESCWQWYWARWTRSLCHVIWRQHLIEEQDCIQCHWNCRGNQLIGAIMVFSIQLHWNFISHTALYSMWSQISELGLKSSYFHSYLGLPFPTHIFRAELFAIWLSHLVMQDPGSISCSPCLVGYFCANVSTSREAMLRTMVCPAGLLCPKGLALAPNASGQACPRGYYCPQGDMVSTLFGWHLFITVS